MVRKINLEECEHVKANVIRPNQNIQPGLVVSQHIVMENISIHEYAFMNIALT